MTDLVSQLVGALEDCLDDSRQALADMEQIYSDSYRPWRLVSQRKTIAEAEAALTAAKAGGWLPIDTAPKDMDGLVVVRWLDSDGAVCNELDHTEDGCWMGWHEHAEHVEIIGGHGVSHTPPYTHWMPLPTPPKEQS